MKKREFAAIFVFAAMLLLSAWNLKKIDSLTGQLIMLLEKSQTCSEALDNRGARKNLNEAIELWLESDSYTHIFIRHSEIDSTTDALYELKETLSGGDAVEARAAYEKIRYHLVSIDTMEHLSFGSIF